ncbi:lysis system o-spanin lipoprotein Rz1 [Pseudocitrobacter sp. RIT415]|uniref:lysis system o-spanin lipoprotein Rz1 n=1 Tax=Pseudocitrobacter sp. RIT415 TaxID=2202163 RepID=UPI0011BD55F2|nr:lysis system o-spanin lipoprotein Rz1 [Pseudocitrobacter sp. RIT 415]
MLKLKTMLLSASLIMVAGCSSKADVQCLPQPKPPAPPAWAMMPPSNSLQLLDETFSVSETGSSVTKHP